MSQTMRRLLVAALAFGVGLALANSFGVLTPSRDVASLTRESGPQDYLYREVILRDELLRMRGLIDRYAADHARGLRPPAYLRSLDDLVREGYLPELPVDPMTGERDWQAEELGCPSSGYSFGVMDVHSKSAAISSDGRPYSEW